MCVFVCAARSHPPQAERHAAPVEDPRRVAQPEVAGHAEREAGQAALDHQAGVCKCEKLSIVLVERQHCVVAISPRIAQSSEVVCRLRWTLGSPCCTLERSLGITGAVPFTLVSFDV